MFFRKTRISLIINGLFRLLQLSLKGRHKYLRKVSHVIDSHVTETKRRAAILVHPAACDPAYPVYDEQNGYATLGFDSTNPKVARLKVRS